MFELFFFLFWIVFLVGLGILIGRKGWILNKIPFFNINKFTTYAEIDMLPDLKKAELMEDSGLGRGDSSYSGTYGTKVRHFIYRQGTEYYTVSTLDGKIFLGFGPYNNFKDAKGQFSNLMKAFPIKSR